MLIDKYQKLNLKNKIIAAIAGFSLVILGLVFFIILPTVRDIKAMDQQIENQRIDLQEKYLKGFSSRQLEENLKKIEPKLDLLDQIFINKNRELEFITTLENQANLNQVSQKIDLSAPQATASQEYQENDLRLTVTGNFNKQLKYLTSLESLNYYINIKSLELTTSAGSGRAVPIINDANREITEAGAINLTLTASTYWK